MYNTLPGQARGVFLNTKSDLNQISLHRIVQMQNSHADVTATKEGRIILNFLRTNKNIEYDVIMLF